MFIVFTQPNKFTKSYNEAVEIADSHYNKTGEIVAVEQSQSMNVYPSDYYSEIVKYYSECNAYFPR